MSGRLAGAMATEERVPRAAADAGAADMADEDAESLAAALAGDEQAFARIYRRWQGPLYRFTLHMSGSESLAEDVTQEVFVMLAQRGDRFDPGKGRFSSYAFAIARNLLRRRLRREGIYAAMIDEPSVGEAVAGAAVAHGGAARAAGASSARTAIDAMTDDPALAPDRALDRQQTVARVRRAICLLPVTFREAIVLCDLQDLSYAEAAAIVGCPVGTVRSRLHRGRQLLAERLRPVMKGPDDSMPGEGRTDHGR